MEFKIGLLGTIFMYLSKVGLYGLKIILNFTENCKVWTFDFSFIRNSLQRTRRVQYSGMWSAIEEAHARPKERETQKHTSVSTSGTGDYWKIVGFVSIDFTHGKAATAVDFLASQGYCSSFCHQIVTTSPTHSGYDSIWPGHPYSFSSEHRSHFFLGVLSEDE